MCTRFGPAGPGRTTLMRVQRHGTGACSVVRGYEPALLASNIAGDTPLDCDNAPSRVIAVTAPPAQTAGRGR